MLLNFYPLIQHPGQVDWSARQAKQLVSFRWELFFTCELTGKLGGKGNEYMGS